MRRATASILAICLLIFSGCSSQKQLEARFDARRQELLAAQSLSFTADVSAQLDDSVFDCRLRCRISGDETTVEILEPDMAQGLRVSFSGEDMSFDYEGVQLYAGKMPNGLGPVESVPLVGRALLKGFAEKFYEESAGEEKLLAVKIYVDEDSYALLRLRLDSMEPLEAEVVSGEKTVLNVKISDFSAD